MDLDGSSISDNSAYVLSWDKWNDRMCSIRMWNNRDSIIQGWLVFADVVLSTESAMKSICVEATDKRW